MDTVDVTLRLDRSVAQRLRDPAECARYEAFLGLVANAASQAEIEDAIQLLKAPPQERQRRVKGTFDDMRQAAAEAGLTSEDVERELAEWKRERAGARRR
jgi:hypothetical protein